MPTGPFAALGTWPVYQHDGSTPRTGATPKVIITKATRKYIKYTRKCARTDPRGQRVHHGKVYYFAPHTYRVSVGAFCHIEAQV
jgi:hypothetical protein